VQPAAAASTAAAGSGFGAKGAVAQPAAQQVLQGDNVLDLLGHCRMLLVVLRGLCATDRGTSPMCCVCLWSSFPTSLFELGDVQVGRCLFHSTGIQRVCGTRHGPCGVWRQSHTGGRQRQPCSKHPHIRLHEHLKRGLQIAYVQAEISRACLEYRVVLAGLVDTYDAAALQLPFAAL